ncbi:MAG: SMP-30/gluconolactonase/LRE family protein, partial [Gaiellales bacterium]
MAVDVLSPAALELIVPDAPLTRLAEGLGFVEGPAWHPDGYLLFTDIAGNAILCWHEQAGVTDWRRPSGHANGLVFRHDGALLVCEHDRSVVLRVKPDGTDEIIASHFEGRELNSPNDLVVARDGSVFFTDPHPSGRTDTWGVERPQELDFNGVYHVPPGAEPRLVVGDLLFPNGLCLSPDEDVLYVNDSLEMSIDA